MAFSSGNHFLESSDILNKISEADILAHYLNITQIPCIINSPLRVDNHPSFGLYSTDGIKIHYKDLSTKESGGTFDLLGKLWNLSYKQVLEKIYQELQFDNKSNTLITKTISCQINSKADYDNSTDLQCKVREWRQYDIEYWESFGISLKWLQYADVYPISHKIVIKGDKKYILSADKYAYAYVEYKENKVTLKIYQPFNTKYKWSNKHDSSVISLWTKIPQKGDKLCICSSLKDALCLWSNIGIPSIAIQGEGYHISNTALNNLKERYTNIYICLDNDEPGLTNANKLAKETQCTNIILPSFKGGKDISDFYKIYGKEKFIQKIKPLFN